jgi:3-hydroxyisobutyrate dehydrogenase
MTTDDSNNSTVPRVAVLGLGTMGAAMATRLLAAGIVVDVWNRNPGPAMTLAEGGATAYAQPADAVSSADVVLTALPTEDALRSVIDGGVLAAFRAGAVWAQMGTIGAAATDALAAEVAARRADVAYVDAPVSGSRGPAEAGELLILAAGSHPRPKGF